MGHGFIVTNDLRAFKQIKRLRFYGIETVEKINIKINITHASMG